jgi:hypothetical protein
MAREPDHPGWSDEYWAEEMARINRKDAADKAEYEAMRKRRGGWLWGDETGRTIRAHGRTFQEIAGE